MNIKTTILTLGMASLVMQSMAQPNEATRQNPLLMKSTLPFGAPDFSKIRTSDYIPAIEAAIHLQRSKVADIVNNKQRPTFQNTILAYDESGALLGRVSNILFALSSADKTPEIAEAEKKAMPLLTALENELMFNKNCSRA